MQYTFKYRNNFIHGATYGNVEYIDWQDRGGNRHPVKSVHAAKCAITRYENKRSATNE